MPSWLNHLDAEILPWLADHAVEGVPVLPARRGASRWRWPRRGCAGRMPPRIEVGDVELRRPLPFEKGRAREIRSVRNRRGRRLGAEQPPASCRRTADPARRRRGWRRPSDVVPAAPYRPERRARTRSRLRRRCTRWRTGSGSIYGRAVPHGARIELLGAGEAVANSTRPVSTNLLDHISDSSRAARRRAARSAGADGRGPAPASRHEFSALAVRAGSRRAPFGRVPARRDCG